MAQSSSSDNAQPGVRGLSTTTTVCKAYLLAVTSGGGRDPQPSTRLLSSRASPHGPSWSHNRTLTSCRDQTAFSEVRPIASPAHGKGSDWSPDGTLAASSSRCNRLR
ncbi:unnamed protein product [Parajaminaea phylloscopi]